MSIQTLAQSLAGGLGGVSDHSGATPYDLAFLSSTAVEVIAVATVIAILAMGLARSAFRSSGLSDRWLRVYRALDVLKLYKMVIPLACLTATVWVWSLVQGV